MDSPKFDLWVLPLFEEGLSGLNYLFRENDCDSEKSWMRQILSVDGPDRYSFSIIQSIIPTPNLIRRSHPHPVPFIFLDYLGVGLL